MTSHSVQLTVEREISAEEALKGLRDAANRLSPASADASLAMEASAETQAPTKPRKPLKRILMAAATVAALGVGGWYGHDYWTVGRFQVSTDDAYVQADNVTIAPKISGYLAAVLVGDNEPVKTGQVLARVDDRDYRTALDQARSNVAVSRAAIQSRKAALATQDSVIESARATIALDQANETFAEQENKRYADLAKTGYGSVQNAQNAASRIAAARASVQRDNAALSSAVRQVDQLKADLAQAEAKLLHDEAAERQAELDLSYTAIVASADGVVGNRTLRVGQYVQAGTQLMSVVPLSAAYVIANYKETQLTDVKAGQKVDIEVDMFPGRVFHGRVDSLAPASGQTFSLLPPDNATGNFTKVVQRIPVRIALDGDVEAMGELRPGMSVVPSIDTRAKPKVTRTASTAN
ncbi:HlyD family secretion protein [Methylobacterium nigriterrae]|uniref:HlyD family secretion protein n=1 Tax=Methylobacterium nigriterrae TaxID=3127512 RepID=UPI003013B49C